MQFEILQLELRWATIYQRTSKDMWLLGLVENRREYHLGNCDKVSKSEKAEEPQTANLFKNPQPASALPTHHHNHCKFLSKFIEMYPNFLKSVWNIPFPKGHILGQSPSRSYFGQTKTKLLGNKCFKEMFIQFNMLAFAPNQLNYATACSIIAA